MQIKILNQLILSRLEKFKKTDFLAICRRQKKKIAISILILLLSLIYFLGLNARRRMAEDTLYWEEQSLLIKSLLGQANSEQEIIGLLEKRYRQTHRIILLQKGQDILQLVKDYAQRMNIRVVNIQAYPVQALKHASNNPVTINSRILQTLLIQMQLDAGYLNLVKYIDILERIVPGIVTAERLEIKKDKINPDKLKVMLELRLYSLSL